MKMIPLRQSVVYGPINSRRFGKSLGINLLPSDCKFCTFSCVYCQHADTPGKAPKFPTFDEVTKEADEVFQKADKDRAKIDWIMLSGNGEPTLHTNFADLVESIISLRNLYLPRIPIGILSNSSTCYKDDIRYVLSLLDGRFMKLDAGSLYTFHDVNRPSTMFAWGDVIQGLCDLPSVTIQSMFVTGKVDNTNEKCVNDWIEAVQCIKPVEVQIYTVERNPQEDGILPVEEEKLHFISNKLKEKTNIPSNIYYEGDDL